MRGGGILGVIVLVWLLIGVFAAYQRDYFKAGETNCATAGSIALTVVAGPLNYAGVNPEGRRIAISRNPVSNPLAVADSKNGVAHDRPRSDPAHPGLIFGISILTYIGVVLHRHRRGVLDSRIRRPSGRR